MVILIIINFFIKFGTLTNVIQHLIRLSDTSKATKARLEKIGQNKLGPGGYSNLAARIVSIENLILHPNNIRFILEKCKNNDVMQLCRPTDSNNFPLRKT